MKKKVKNDQQTEPKEKKWKVENIIRCAVIGLRFRSVWSHVRFSRMLIWMGEFNFLKTKKNIRRERDENRGSRDQRKKECLCVLIGLRKHKT